MPKVLSCLLFSGNEGRFDCKKLWNHEQFLYVAEWRLWWPTWGNASSSRPLAWYKQLRCHEGYLSFDWNLNLTQFNNRNHTRELLRNANDKTVFTTFLIRTMRSFRETFLVTSPARRASARSRRARGSWAPTLATPASSPVSLLTFRFPPTRDQQITAN